MSTLRLNRYLVSFLLGICYLLPLAKAVDISSQQTTATAAKYYMIGNDTPYSVDVSTADQAIGIFVEAYTRTDKFRAHRSVKEGETINLTFVVPGPPPNYYPVAVKEKIELLDYSGNRHLVLEHVLLDELIYIPYSTKLIKSGRQDTWYIQFSKSG